MKNGFHFSKLEIKHLVWALIAIAIAFQAGLFRIELCGGFDTCSLGTFLTNMFSAAQAIYLLEALFIVGLAFVLHEMGHKYIAQKAGLWAEFRAWPFGLIISVAIALLTKGRFVFVAPGAVMILPKKGNDGTVLKKLDKSQIGKIGIIGALINLELAAAFSLLTLLFAAKLFVISAQINAWLAIFNLLPIPPLDGSKVWIWGKGIWLATFLAALFIFGLTVLLVVP